MPMFLKHLEHTKLISILGRANVFSFVVLKYAQKVILCYRANAVCHPVTVTQGIILHIKQSSIQRAFFFNSNLSFCMCPYICVHFQLGGRS